MKEKKLIFRSFIDLMESLPDEKTCRDYLEQIRWCGEPFCPHCGSASEVHYKLKADGLYKCRDCKMKFTVTVGTMFESSHVSLKKWFTAIYIFLSHKKGISSVQLGKDIDVSQKTAWFMLCRIRNNFEHKIDFEFTSDYQVDETFIGGKPRRREKIEIQENIPKREKIIVTGIYSNGYAYARIVPNRNAETLEELIYEKIPIDSRIVTDGWKGYNGLKKNYTHIVVNHSEGQYVNYGYTTNHMENFWGHLKRGIIGIYHLVSSKHLQKYCDEFCFRFNTRMITDGERFYMFMASSSKRLRYKDLIYA